MPEIAAGRELDALVAEKLFGWVWLRNTIRVQTPDKKGWLVEWRRSLFIPNHEVKPFLSDHGNEYIPAIGDEEIGVMNAPPYSTSIADAWAVVEKMQSAGYLWEVCNCIPPDIPPYGASFIPRSECGYDYDENRDAIDQGFVLADTAPLAICRAALKALAAEESA